MRPLPSSTEMNEKAVSHNKFQGNNGTVNPVIFSYF